MHIPENYLSPSTCGVMAAAMVPVWIHSVRTVNKDLPAKKIPLLGVGASFSFLSMMFNIPLPGGTTGHAVGGTLIAILLGPEAACLSVTIALAIQALLFGDGGILSFGANCFNMAFVLPYAGCYIYRLLAGKKSGLKRKLVSAALGSYIGINAAALCAAVEFGIQPYLFHDAAGHALYCPYPLSVSIPAMMIGHLTLSGLAEVVFTIGILAFLYKTSPEFMENKDEKIKTGPLAALIAMLIALVPLGLLADGTAWGEWGAEEIQEATGISYVPQKIARGWSMQTLFPDYSMNGLPESMAYILSAVIGTALAVILFRLAASFHKDRKKYNNA